MKPRYLLILLLLSLLLVACVITLPPHAWFPVKATLTPVRPTATIVSTAHVPPPYVTRVIPTATAYK